MKSTLALVAASLLLAGCGSSSSSSSSSSSTGPEVQPNVQAGLVGGPGGKVTVGGKYWARTNLRIVKGVQIDFESWLSGEFLPMGTGLTVTETAKSDTKWHVKADDGRDFWIVPADRGQDVFREIQKFLAPQDPKAGFDAGAGEVADGIRFGRPVTGMTKAQVLGACGFPPHISDPSTADQWRYPQWGHGWRGRSVWGTAYNHHEVVVEFTDGKVVRVIGFEQD